MFDEHNIFGAIQPLPKGLIPFEPLGTTKHGPSAATGGLLY